MQFKEAVKLVGISEGGYDNNPHDSGNFVNGVLIGTKFGISARAYYIETGKIPSVPFMKVMTFEEAEAHYKRFYWDKFLIESYDEEFRYPIFDMYVNHSPDGVKTILERARALETYLNSGKVYTMESITKCRMVFYKQITERNHETKFFLNGWIKRAKEVYKNQTGKEFIEK